MSKKRKAKGGEQSVERCLRTTADGRRCRMPARPGHDSLCLPHWQRRNRDSKTVSAELLGPFAKLNTATAVNHALAKLFSLVAQGRIPSRDAAVLAYIGQLLLSSLSAVRHEAELARGHDKWHGDLRRTLREAILGRQDLLAELEDAPQFRPVEVKYVAPGQKEEDSNG